MLSLKQTLSYSVLAAAVALAGCSSKTKVDDQAGVDTLATAPDTTYRTGSANTITGIDIPRSSIPGEGPANVAHVVYFDFDSYTVKPEYQSTLQSHADFLRNNRSTTIVLEGHTDDLGGTEYNLALGQRRAAAVQQSLGLLGVPATQAEAVGYGKERPRATGASENARAENRRVEIRYNP